MAKQDVKAELSYGGSWHDITFSDDVYARDPVEITHGRADEVSTTPPAAASLTLDNRDGTYNPRNPKSALFGIGRNLPVRVTVGSDVRFVGEASSWSPRRAIKGDAWTEVRASGLLRRLSQGHDPLQSALRRYIPTTSPRAYWAGTEGSASDEAALTVGAGTPLRTILFGGGIQPGTGDLAAWLEPALTLRGSAIHQATVRASTTTPTQVTFDYVRKGSAGGPGTVVWRLYGGALLWSITTFASGTNETDIQLRNAGTSVALFTDTTDDDLFDNDLHYVRFDMVQNGADIDTTLYVDNVALMVQTFTGQTLTSINTVEVEHAGADSDTIAIGHITLWEGSPADRNDVWDAVQGYASELTVARFQRLCTEEGITATVVGDTDDCPPMGPQFPDTLVNQFREIETTDDGFVYETRDGNGLTMRTGRSCWNQDSVLELNWDAYEVAPPTDPVVDDLNTRNDITATRRSGASARAERASGPLNVEAPEDDDEGVGRYTHQVDVNPFSDLVLADYAGWHLHRGTVDETRWPAVTVDLDATPGVDVSAVEIGDRITIVNMPAEITPDTVSLIVLGWSETVGTHRRRVTFNCAPESPLHVAELTHADYSFVGSDGSTVNTAFVAGTGTSLSVAVAAGHPLWAYESTFDILVAGVRLRVTGISGASSPQTFTVQAAPINGVTKTIAAGERVDLFYPCYVGL